MPTPTKLSETKHLLSPTDGDVLITVETTVSEREIAEARNEIVVRLDGTYRNLVYEMREFQQRWDEDPASAFLEAVLEGGHAGSAEWLSEQEEMFHAEFWNDLGNSIKKATGSALDRAAIYSAQRYDEIKKETNKHLEHPEDTILNWAWWQKMAVDASTDVQAQHSAYVREVTATATGAVQSVRDSADKLAKIYRHREAILNLPVLIAEGMPRPIQVFVDTVLMDIDPALAKEIRNSPNFSVVLAIIDDHDSALSYLSYVGLMLEAIPPNFYAYAAGKGGAFVLIELVMLIVTALLSAGAVAATRIALLMARLTASGVKLISTNRRLRRAKLAVESVKRMIQDLEIAAKELHELGAKLVAARSKGFVIRGRTKTTLHAKKGAIKRDAKCKVCGSTKHHTPRRRRGTIEYE